MYPCFAIVAAAAEHGLKIMMMLYLTPVLPLGPVSYMCGTTSMPLSSFVIAKVAALPLMLLYVFIGASMGTLIGGDANKAAAEVQHIEENEYLIASGILLSFVMIACITRQVKKELNKVRKIAIFHFETLIACLGSVAQAPCSHPSICSFTCLFAFPFRSWSASKSSSRERRRWCNH